MSEAWSAPASYRDPEDLSSMLGIPRHALPPPQIDSRGMIGIDEALRFDAQRRYPEHTAVEREHLVRFRLRQLRRLARAARDGDHHLESLLRQVLEIEADIASRWYAEHAPPPEPMTWDDWAASAPHVVERLAADAETKHSAESWAAAAARARARAARERQSRSHA